MIADVKVEGHPFMNNGMYQVISFETNGRGLVIGFRIVTEHGQGAVPMRYVVGLTFQE